jgi:hypothetical protein
MVVRYPPQELVKVFLAGTGKREACENLHQLLRLISAIFE